jgi:hypothetical protein
LLRRFADAGDTSPDENDTTPLEKLYEISDSLSSVGLISKPAQQPNELTDDSIQ